MTHFGITLVAHSRMAFEKRREILLHCIFKSSRAIICCTTFGFLKYSSYSESKYAHERVVYEVSFAKKKPKRTIRYCCGFTCSRTYYLSLHLWFGSYRTANSALAFVIKPLGIINLAHALSSNPAWSRILLLLFLWQYLINPHTWAIQNHRHTESESTGRNLCKSDNLHTQTVKQVHIDKSCDVKTKKQNYAV